VSESKPISSYVDSNQRAHVVVEPIVAPSVNMKPQKSDIRDLINTPIFLGHYLVLEGLITQQQLKRAVAYQKRHNPRVGDLAVSRGLMARPAAEAVNKVQKNRDALYGDLCIEFGLLTQQQRDQLVADQHSTYQRLGKILVRLGAITKEALEEALEEFQERASTEQLVAISDISLAGDSLNDSGPASQLLDTLVETARKLLYRVGGITTKVGICFPSEASTVKNGHSAHVTLSGTHPTTVALTMTRDLAVEYAGVAAEQAVRDEGLVGAFVSELCNMICGNAANALPEFNIALSPPRPGLRPTAGRDYIVPLYTTDGGVAEIRVALDPTSKP